MEKLTDQSELTIPSAAVVHKIPQTVVGIRSRSRQRIVTNTAVDSSKTVFNFTLNPQIPSEVDTKDSYLVFTVKPTKNGGAYGATDQISTVQAPGKKGGL